MNNLRLTKSKDNNNVVTNPQELLKICDNSSKSIFDILNKFNNDKKHLVLKILWKIRFQKSIFLIEDYFGEDEIEILKDPVKYFQKELINDNIDLLIAYFNNNKEFINHEFLKYALKSCIFYHKWDYYSSIISACDAHKYSICPHYDLELSLYDDNAVNVKNKIDKQIASDLLHVLDSYSIYFQYIKN